MTPVISVRAMQRALLLFLIAACPVGADTIVLRDRTVLRGTPEEGKRKGFKLGKRRFQKSEVLLWENDEGRMTTVVPFVHQVRAYRALADASTLKTCLELLPGALAAKNADALRTLLDRAESAGLEGKAAESWGRKLKGVARAKEVQPFEVPVLDALETLLLERARIAREDKNETRALRILRVALDEFPEHARVKAALEKAAPKDWRLGDLRNWLEWRLQVTSQRDTHMCRRVNYDRVAAQNRWGGAEVHGVESDDVVLLTTLKDPLPVGRCVKLARLTCRALERIFYTHNPVREDRDPLIIYLFENKEDYIKLSGGGGHLGWTLGHYSPSDNLSRFYWMKRPDAMRTVTTTFVHELTHHWIERRNPRYTREVTMRSVQTPGYWIVEGFATFMQEGRYDVERGEWTHYNKHAQTLDVVGDLAKRGSLLDWNKVYPLNQRDFHEVLSKEFNVRPNLKWSLKHIGLSEVNLFYMQAGATCQYLFHAENGKLREKLLNYVVAYYTNDATMTKVEEAFGMTPDELGEKVAAFAKSIR